VVSAPLRYSEVESKVHHPGTGLGLFGGGVFFVVGVVALANVHRIVNPGEYIWVFYLGTGLFAAMGGIVLGATLAKRLRPTRVRHAAADVLPDVAGEPVPEGSGVYFRLTHELVDDGRGGRQFRPATQAWRYDRNFLLGFGIPFGIFFTGLLTWAFHNRYGFAWPMAATLAIGAALFCGVVPVTLVGFLMRATYRRLGRLDIPRDGGDLEWTEPADPDFDPAAPVKGLRWVSVGDVKRRHVTIPRNQVAAVQLCPWKYKRDDNEMHSGVQGLLVLTPSAEGVRERIPLFMTGDYDRAALVMQQLAEALEVPYLFHADAAGWQAEEQRAATRPPLKTGGSQS
jgi:hypothetical protein